MAPTSGSTFSLHGGDLPLDIGFLQDAPHIHRALTQAPVPDPSFQSDPSQPVDWGFVEFVGDLMEGSGIPLGL